MRPVQKALTIRFLRVPLSYHAVLLHSLLNTSLDSGRPRDVDANGTVDGSDTVLLEDAFYSKPASENWNPDADINNNLTVDIYDAIILSSNFAKTI